MNQLELDNLCLSAETTGRQKFLNFLIKKQITQIKEADLQDHFDVAFTADSRSYIAEVKQRSDQYAECNDMLLEVSKYCNLKQIAKETNSTPIYINVYDSCNLLKASNINKLKLNTVYTQLLPSTNYTCNTKNKQIIYLQDYKEYYI